ncbi:major capsid protein [Methylorubrum extorquens]
MLTITEWAKLNPTPLASGVVQIFAESNPVLALMPFSNVAGNSYRYNREEALPGIAFRDFNEGYAESTGVVNPHTEKLTIIGGDSDYDVAQIKMGVGTNDTRAVHDAMKAKALAREWLKTFFDGDTNDNAKAFDGLKVRITGDQVLTAGANGASITFDMLDELCDAVSGGPSALFLRKSLIRQYRTLLRTSGGTTPESIMIPNFGQPAITHNGVPLLPVEEDSLGNEILPANEAQGTANDTTSIYAVKFGPDMLSGIQTGPVDVRDLGEIEAKPAYRTRIEWYSGICIKHPRAVARLKGVKAAA